MGQDLAVATMIPKGSKIEDLGLPPERLDGVIEFHKRYQHLQTYEIWGILMKRLEKVQGLIINSLSSAISDEKTAAALSAMLQNDNTKNAMSDLFSSMLSAEETKKSLAALMAAAMNDESAQKALSGMTSKTLHAAISDEENIKALQDYRKALTGK
jgi:hypothetical protein